MRLPPSSMRPGLDTIKEVHDMVGANVSFEHKNFPKVVTRLDELMKDFLCSITDYDRNS